MDIKDDPVYQDKLRKMHAVRRYLKAREKVYIARRDAGFNVKEEERVRAWLSEYACYLEADAHWLKEDYERRKGRLFHLNFGRMYGKRRLNLCIAHKFIGCNL